MVRTRDFDILIHNLEKNSFYSNVLHIKEYFSSKNIETILKITTLDFNLRATLIQLFLILYINAIIDEKKINIYRTQFQLNINESLNNNYLGEEERRFFTFYYMLLNINRPALIDEEYNILINEIKNFNEILNYSNLKTEEELKNYYEYGIILPLNVYLNKVFSYINKYNGNDLLKIYSLTYNTLSMMKLYSNKMLLIKVTNENEKSEALLQENNENHNAENIISQKSKKAVKSRKKNSIKVKSILIRQLDKYQNILTLQTNCPMNYSILYNILSETVLNYFDDKLKSLSHNIYEENDTEKDKTKEDDKDKSIILSKIKEIYHMYINDKENYDNLSHKSVLDLNYSSNENTYRKILVKYLLNLNVEEISVYDNESIDILIILLNNETENTQNSIMALLNKKEFQKLIFIIL